MRGYKLHIMTHTPYPEDKSSLPNGIYILKTYNELKDGSQNVSVVLRNLTSKMIHLAPGRCVARVAAANEVPEAMPCWNWLRTWMRLYRGRPQSSRSRSNAVEKHNISIQNKYSKYTQSKYKVELLK